MSYIPTRYMTSCHMIRRRHMGGVRFLFDKRHTKEHSCKVSCWYQNVKYFVILWPLRPQLVSGVKREIFAANFLNTKRSQYCRYLVTLVPKMPGDITRDRRNMTKWRHNCWWRHLVIFRMCWNLSPGIFRYVMTKWLPYWALFVFRKFAANRKIIPSFDSTKLGTSM